MHADVHAFLGCSLLATSSNNIHVDIVHAGIWMLYTIYFMNSVVKGFRLYQKPCPLKFIGREFV